jgi:D-alanyl-D-alanine carboxypeptidase/D-alanyl-D-alanine-endopeptidase (penicillin-binding protein 4)
MRRATVVALAGAIAISACARPAATGRTEPSAGRADARAVLRAAIDSMVEAPAFRNAHWGILIVDPERGDTLYSRNAGKLFMPASNQKLLTGSTALAQLGPDFRWRTTFAARGRAENGVLDGDLLVLGSGDPTVSDAMRGDAMQPLREIADSIRARGITRIRGRVLSGRDAFPDSTLGFGWAWDDLDAPYSAGIDELFFNEGFSRIVVLPASSVDLPVRVRTAPSRAVPTVISRARTVERPDGDVAVRAANTLALAGIAPAAEALAGTDSLRNVAVLTGTLAMGDSAELEIAHRDPAGAYLAALSEALRERGVAVDGRPLQRALDAASARMDSLFTTLSPPLRTVLPRLEKPSQNQIAEIFFKTLGLERTGVGTADSGRAVVERQLMAWGAVPGGFAVRDGSGLSRHDYVTPETLVKVLDAMRRHAEFRLFYDALPIAGVDGTIRNRMKGTTAQGNVHAKTGTLDKARSLSGYVTTADGRLLLFSFLANNWTTPVRQVEQVQDAIAVRLAEMR